MGNAKPDSHSNCVVDVFPAYVPVHNTEKVNKKYIQVVQARKGSNS